MSDKRNRLLILLSIGLAAIIYAIGYSYVSFQINAFSITAGMIGLSAVIVSLVKIKTALTKNTKSSGFKHIIVKAGIILIYVIILAEINFLASSYNKRFDLTKFKQHTLTNETVSLIKDIKKKIAITAFYAGMPPKYLEDLLSEYARVSGGRISAEIIDPIVQIGYAAEFGNVINEGEKKVIVKSGNERRDVDFTKSPLTEEVLTNAIIRISRKERTAYFLTGNGANQITDKGDRGFSKLAQLLLKNNIKSKELFFGALEVIPDDCDVLIIAGLQEDLDEKQLNIINKYLETGGDVLFLIENVVVTTADKPLSDKEINKNPSLNEILEKWGVKVGNDVVVDLSSHASGDVGSPATRNYIPHQALITDLDYTFYVRPRSLAILRERRKTIMVAPFVLSASQKEASWAETNRYLQVKYDEGIDIPGPVCISGIIWEEKEKNDKSDTRIAVFTDSDFLTNNFIDVYSNARMGLNVINWLTDADYKVFVAEKKSESE